MSATNRGTKRNEKDAYNTPSWCTELIVREIVWGATPVVYEPCAGDGAICDVLNKTTDAVVFAADINPDSRFGGGEDFLKNDEDIRYDFILTNPPFSLAQEFIEKSLQIANCVVMLLPLGFYGSESRHEWWSQHEPTAQFVLSKRPMFGKNKDGRWGSDSETYAWLMWDVTGRQKRGFYHLCPTEEQYKQSVAEFKKRYEAMHLEEALEHVGV